MRIPRLRSALFALALSCPLSGHADIPPIRHPPNSMPPPRTAPPPLKNIDPAWGGIAGVITDQQSGKPLNGAFVYVRRLADDSDVVVMVRSDAKGSYRIAKLPPGDYNLSGSWFGLSYEHEGPVHVVNQQTQTLNLTLHDTPHERPRPDDELSNWSKCKILQSYREANQTHLFIDLGSDDQVKVGSEGTILDSSVQSGLQALAGGQFKVTEIRDKHVAKATSSIRSIGKNTRCAVNTANR